MKKIIFCLFASGILIGCSPSTSNSSSSTNNSTQSASSPLPFPDATPNSWQAALREVFLAVRSLQLNEIEKLTVLDIDNRKVSNISLNFTPLERQKVVKLFELQGQRSLAGFFCETMKSASFDQVQKISETDNLVVVYFTYRTADLPTAQFAFNTGSTFDTLTSQFNGLNQRPMVKEAQWRFVKNVDKFVLVYEGSGTNPISKLISPKTFMTELTININKTIEDARL